MRRASSEDLGPLAFVGAPVSFDTFESFEWSMEGNPAVTLIVAPNPQVVSRETQAVKLAPCCFRQQFPLERRTLFGPGDTAETSFHVDAVSKLYLVYPRYHTIPLL